jgi:hypothetical protein
MNFSAASVAPRFEFIDRVNGIKLTAENRTANAHVAPPVGASFRFFTNVYSKVDDAFGFFQYNRGRRPANREGVFSVHGINCETQGVFRAWSEDDNSTCRPSPASRSMRDHARRADGIFRRAMQRLPGH